jgi:uncharacterized membrane protein
MKAPQIIMIVLLSIGIVSGLMKHGEQRKDKYSVWSSLFGAALMVALLWWGGFWG